MDLLLFHVGVIDICQRDEGLFDRLGVAPPQKVMGATCLVVGT